MNLLMLSGEARPLTIAVGDRRFFVGAVVPGEFETHTQPRLFIERFQLVQVPGISRHAPAIWAMPGGGRATTAQLLALARQRGWKRPRVVEVAVRYRKKDKGK